jgi:probable lipoprotein NlpC
MKYLLIFLLSFTISITAFSQRLVDTQKILSFIDDWRGKPYLFGGSTKRGVDCSALMQKAYKFIFNADIPRTCYYQFKNLNIFPLDSLKMGDLIFFRSSLSPSGWHVGLYIGNNEFFHAANHKYGVLVSCLDDFDYRKRIMGVGRL